MKLVVHSALVAALALGCSKKKAPGAAPAPSTSPQHAQAGAKPGSHEDWCTEHDVPESQCTLCNPSLSAAFKATGDWCAEHGLPESHCRKCHPDLKLVRPPKAN
ncbi:MAG: hypothetical protein IPM35_01435 [Myxococcales bacterium]|nr:hypothetical protein [Myxococcales bacterium]